MDNSEKYILMCEKAEKYLPEWTYKDIDSGDYLQCKYSKPDGELISANHIMAGLEMGAGTRIYRQDQLQDMIYVLPTDRRYNQKELYNISFVSCPDVICKELAKFLENDCSMKLETMEQLGLAFVMKEKYSMEGNEKDWVEN